MAEKTPEQMIMDRIVLTQQLEALYRNIETAKAELETFEDLAAKIEDLKTQKSGHEQDIQGLEEKKSAVKHQLDSAKSRAADTLNQLETQTEEQRKVSRQLVQANQALQVQNAQLEPQISQLVEQKDQLVKALEKPTKDLQEVQALLGTEAAKVKPLQDQIAIHQQMLEGLKQDLVVQSAKKEELKGQITEHTTHIGLLKNIVSDLQKDQADQKAKIAQDQVAHEAYIADTEAQLAQKKSALDDREADLSLSDKWIQEKIAKVRDYKGKLEVFYGKRFENLEF